MRTGHETVGRLVAQCETNGGRLMDLTLEELQEACSLIDESVYGVLGTKNAMAALQSFGSVCLVARQALQRCLASVDWR